MLADKRYEKGGEGGSPPSIRGVWFIMPLDADRWGYCNFLELSWSLVVKSKGAFSDGTTSFQQSVSSNVLLGRNGQGLSQPYVNC